MAPGSVCGTVLVVFGCLFLWGAGKIYSAEKKREGVLSVPRLPGGAKPDY